MFKIGEFSRITQVSIRMLRYYDEQELLKPSVVDKYTGYRLYEANQIEQLNRIIMLKNMGFNIKEMKEMLTSWDSKLMKENLEDQINKVKQTIKTEQARLSQIEGYLADLNKKDKKLNIQIVMKKIPTYHVLSMRKVVQNYYCEGQLWKEFGEFTKDIEDIDTKQSFSIYHDLDYREENVDIEVCIVCDNDLEFYKDYTNNHLKSTNLIFRQVIGIDIAASIMIYGPYSSISSAYKEFAYWLDQHKEYRMAGENRQICHVSMCHTTDPNEYITELLIPLEKIDKNMVSH